MCGGDGLENKVCQHGVAHAALDMASPARRGVQRLRTFDVVDAAHVCLHRRQYGQCRPPLVAQGHAHAMQTTCLCGWRGVFSNRHLPQPRALRSSARARSMWCWAVRHALTAATLASSMSSSEVHTPLTKSPFGRYGAWPGQAKEANVCVVRVHGKKNGAWRRCDGPGAC